MPVNFNPHFHNLSETRKASKLSRAQLLSCIAVHHVIQDLKYSRNVQTALQHQAGYPLRHARVQLWKIRKILC